MTTPDPFEALEAYDELTRLYRRDGLNTSGARVKARQLMESFVSGFGLSLPPLSPPAASPLPDAGLKDAELAVNEATRVLTDVLKDFGTPASRVQRLRDDHGVVLVRRPG